MSGKAGRWLVFAVVSAVVFGLDQLAKWLVVQNLALGESWVPVPAIADVIRVTRSYNTGAAFGMFPMGSNVIVVLAFITVAVFLWMVPTLPPNAWLSRVGIALTTGGALSNAVDRLRFDHVVDYVHVQLTPTFANISNFADHAITVGVILLLIDQWLHAPEHAESEAATTVVEEDELAESFPGDGPSVPPAAVDSTGR